MKIGGRKMKTKQKAKIVILALGLVLMLAVLCPILLAFAETEEEYVSIDDIKSVTASSYVPGYEPEKAFDGIEGDVNNCWHTPWGAEQEPYPHWIMAEFSSPQTIDALIFVPRGPSPHTFVSDYEVWISPDADPAHLEKVTEGTWKRADRGVAAFTEREAVLVKFVINDRVDSDTHEPNNTSVNASEIKFRMPSGAPGNYDESITETSARAESLIAYAKDRVGSAAYQFDATLLKALEQENTALKALVGSSDKSAVEDAIREVEAAMASLLESACPEGEPLTTEVPHSMMTASASSSNFSYRPMSAIDGNTATIWHSEWMPENDPFPHTFTLDLGRTLLLHDISILPRQDASAGKILRGEIYAGDTPDDMTLVATFRSSSNFSATKVSLDCVSARYIEIVSLAASSANTAIAEITVTSYDRGVLAAFAAYDEACDLIKRAVVGDAIGNYTEETVDNFKKEVNEFLEKLSSESLSTGEAYRLLDEITEANNAFVAAAKEYTKADLDDFIEKLKSADIVSGDRAAADALLAEAEGVAAGTPSSEELRAVCTKLSAFVAMIESDGKSLDLAGEWDLALSGFEGDKTVFGQYVSLPGTLDTNKIGTYNTLDETYRLSRLYSYTGPASYRKSVFISDSLKGKEITLFMERTRCTRVYVNGKEVTAPETSNLLPVSSRYNLTSALKYGEFNDIVIVVDNSYPGLPAGPILNSHMATAETQTNWNGIVGRFELIVTEKVSIDSLRVYPNSDLKSVRVEADLYNRGADAASFTLTLSLPGAKAEEISVSLAAGESRTVTCESFAMPADVKLWSEFHPDLYTMTASLSNGEKKDAVFGMRVFTVSDDGSALWNNGKAVLIRGEANCAVFPLTGYAPMDVESWEKLFSTYQSYGINAVRFHSWCPPEAAFVAADKLGLYLQPELSAWDGGMMNDDTKKTYYSAEAFAILKEYANHPSFVMFTFGNELMYSDSDFRYADSLIEKLKEADSTRLYAQGSNTYFGGYNPTEQTDFYTAQSYMGMALRGAFGGLTGFINQTYPGTRINFSEAVNRLIALSVPVFSFEVGQYQVFPDLLTEISKYTGVLEARNFEVVAEKAAARGMTEEDIADWINASGMLSRIGYRMEIEAVRRTEGMSGISLLGIQDFPGQGTALVGMMNALGEPKPYAFADPEYFSSFFGPIALLLETDKFCYKNSETIEGDILVSNYSENDFTGVIHYALTLDGKVIAEGDLASATFAQGKLSRAGSFSIPLASVSSAAKLELAITCGEEKNSYSFWVYPDGVAEEKGEVYVAEALNETVLSILEEGGKVFLSPRASKDNFPNSVAGRFTTAFWSTNDKANQAGLMGLLLDPEHPLFKDFPTEYHSDIQWWIMTTNGRPMNLEGLTTESGEKIEPLIRVLDDLDGVKTMGLLFEVTVGKGKLVVSSMGLTQVKDEYPEAEALYNAILSYMNSDAFQPDFAISVETLMNEVTFSENQKTNVALADSGATFYTGANTATCQGGYDGALGDRLLEINDGTVDCDNNSRSWSDYRSDGNYPGDAELGVDFATAQTIDSIGIAFFEDTGCKAASSIRILYWNGSEFVEVTNPSMTTGFAKGMNTVTFDPVTTDRMYFYLEHQKGMGIAVSELLCYQVRVDATAIRVQGQDGKTKVALGDRLPMLVTTTPENANGYEVKWTVTDAAGNPTTLAKIDTDGVLVPLAVGKVTVKASLYGDSSISSTIEIEIVEAGAPTDDTTAETPTTETPDTSGDSDKDAPRKGAPVAGIVLGVIGGLAVIGFGLWFFVFRKRKRHDNG